MVGEDEAREFSVEFVGKPEDLDKVLAESDIVSLHLHLNGEDAAYHKRTPFASNEAERALD